MDIYKCKIYIIDQGHTADNSQRSYSSLCRLHVKNSKALALNTVLPEYFTLYCLCFCLIK